MRSSATREPPLEVFERQIGLQERQNRDSSGLATVSTARWREAAGRPVGKVAAPGAGGTRWAASRVARGRDTPAHHITSEPHADVRAQPVVR